MSVKDKMYGRILALAIPSIISNISVPLLSLADTALAGRMPSAGSLGAVALASVVVSFSLWLFGTLRMATTGFTAQAYGRGDEEAIARQLSVGIFLALVGGLLIIALRPLLAHFLALVGGEGVEEILPEAKRFLYIAYLGAPAALLLYVGNGWFVGMQNSWIPMYTAIGSNVVNILVSVALVYYGKMGVEGIAWGTVVAQYLAVATLGGIILVRYRHLFAYWTPRALVGVKELLSYVGVAKYLILRTLMLGSISLYFLHAGASYGAITLGANALLMQLFSIFSYFMDGFAYAGEALTGRYVGAKDRQGLHTMLARLMTIGCILAPFIALVYWLGGESLLGLLSDKAEVLHEASAYRLWAVVIPLVSFLAFLWDGVFVGMTNSKVMVQATCLSWLTFFLVYWGTEAYLQQHSLWLAFVLYLFVRSAFSTLWGVRLVRQF